MKRLIINVPKIKNLTQKTTLIVAALSLLGMYLPALTSALSDTTPPTITDLSSLSQSSYDTTSSGVNITFTGSFNDNLSGVQSVDITYSSPSGNQATGGYCTLHADGTPADCQVTFGRYAENGVWLPTFKLRDTTGNVGTYNNVALLAMSYDMRVTVTGTGDTTPPTLTSLTSPSPSSYDATNGGVNTTFNGTFADDLSDVQSVNIVYVSPSGNQTTGGYCTLQADGSPAICNVTFGQYAENGVWTPTFTVKDTAGNISSYSNTQLVNLGYDMGVTVTGTADTTAPTISTINFSVAHPAVEAPLNGAIVTMDGAFGDVGSGLQNANISYTSPSGNQSTNTDFYYNADSNKYIANLTLPPYAESGTWIPTVALHDNAGNFRNYTTTDLKNMGQNREFSIYKSVGKTLAAGETLATDVENDGATTLDPVEASVMAPSGGDASIVMISADAVTDNANGYTFFGRQISIVAPVQSSEAPLSISFRIDSSVIPAGQNASTLQVVKNGEILPACVDGTTANPDACVYSRQTMADGDIQVSIHSTTASLWTAGFPTPPAVQKFDFSGFYTPVKNLPAVNKIEAGSGVPILFSLNGDKGLKVLAANSPSSKPVNCNTGVAIGTETAAASWLPSGLQYVPFAKTYAYVWKTDKKWGGTCRQFNLTLTDGTAHSALFKFSK